MELMMNATVDSRLATFNTLALHHQDEAYTLAYYLSGNESAAEAATQAAFAWLYRRQGVKVGQFRLEVLRQVWMQLHKNRQSTYATLTGDELRQKLGGLKEEERLAVVLVDVLGLNYSEAECVMDCTKKQLIHLLALGRMKMAQAKYAAAA